MIGRVGATGTATGPHLDYRLKKNGVWINPLAEAARMPSGEAVPAAQRAAFQAARADVLGLLSRTPAGSKANN
jgi:murein DD-endopeptidase MepM/ murein hydrolase activator NlpD